MRRCLPTAEMGIPEGKEHILSAPFCYFAKDLDSRESVLELRLWCVGGDDGEVLNGTPSFMMLSASVELNVPSNRLGRGRVDSGSPMSCEGS